VLPQEIVIKLKRKMAYLDKKLYKFEKYLKRFLYFCSKRGISENKLIYFFLLSMMSIYFIVFSMIPISQHNAFATFGFDLGLVDQQIWLVSQGKEPFSTIRGLHTFGDHVPVIVFFIAPLYWFWADVKAILILQTVVIALGAIPIYWLARDKLKKKWISLIFPLVYFLYPAVEYINLWHFHFEALAISFILFAFYYMTKEKYILFGLFSFLAIACKETVSIVILFLGVYIFMKHSRKLGIITALASMIWLIVCMSIILPYFNEFGSPHLIYRYGAFGSTFEELAANLILKPDLVLSTIFTPFNMKYLFELLAPVGFISLLSPPTLAISVPTMITHLLSGHEPQRTIYFQYTAAIIPFIFISLIYGSARIIKGIKSKYFLVIFLLIITLLSNHYLSSSPISINPVYYLMPDNVNTLNNAISIIPEDANVSATYLLVPHLSHRERIYEFPNPFKSEYWGIKGENPHDPRIIEYIILNKGLMSEEWKRIAQSLLDDGNYTIVLDEERVLLLRRSDIV